ncbi:eukaryotic translation initiation factor [Theileria orientalis strain Shintoku]|uniref:Eukaryotic translation initiation factor 5A n=1 Tax=Theileria orientalis strain Shintoku TaxID=869250 RepID=J4D667_THEOR|nr:eukaryotic translation initiation factor [Theileria orientalis strain Shintoku]PVC54814.1 eukaryotic translation initiation factor [Theileria orientalis]BAM39375.1 eukaryotic translation initiation factor [Theileria orientalis strain Shintoku]|eukprot:XP_009689676.1 eukaryotic translation initiation factor [Theileria orientalis strain Shintoku]
MFEEDFEGGDAGASQTVPVQAGSIKKNSFVMIKGHPCKVVEYSTSKTGKHGHAKANITGIDIFTGKKYEDICPTSHNMDVPHVKRTEIQLIGIEDDGFVTLLNPDGSCKNDLQLPKDSEGNHDDVAKQVQTLFDSGKEVLVTVLTACGMEKIIACKELS